MPRKQYILSEEHVNVIHDVMKEKGFNTEVNALAYIISEYKNRQELPNEIVKCFNEVNGAWMERLRWAAQSAEQNSQIMLDVINTLMFEKDPESVVTTDEIMHPVIAQSKDRIKDRIAHFKQKKDSRKNKEKI